MRVMHEKCEGRIYFQFFSRCLVAHLSLIDVEMETQHVKLLLWEVFHLFKNHAP